MTPLPTLLITTGPSQVRLRVHAAAWSTECGGKTSRAGDEHDGLLLLSATGADTATKAARAVLYQPDIAAEFRFEFPDDNGDSNNSVIRRLAKAQYDGKQVAYQASVAKLAPGAIHLVAVAKIPGLMPCLDDAHLWTELSGPRYNTPILKPWVGWIKRKMIESDGILIAEGHNAQVGILTTKQEELDEIVSQGVRTGYLRMK